MREEKRRNQEKGTSKETKEGVSAQAKRLENHQAVWLTRRSAIARLKREPSERQRQTI